MVPDETLLTLDPGEALISGDGWAIACADPNQVCRDRIRGVCCESSSEFGDVVAVESNEEMKQLIVGHELAHAQRSAFVVRAEAVQPGGTGCCRGGVARSRLAADLAGHLTDSIVNSDAVAGGTLVSANICV